MEVPPVCQNVDKLVEKGEAIEDLLEFFGTNEVALRKVEQLTNEVQLQAPDPITVNLAWNVLSSARDAVVRDVEGHEVYFALARAWAKRLRVHIQGMSHGRIPSPEEGGFKVQ
jgi:hypothetical protein